MPVFLSSESDKRFSFATRGSNLYFVYVFLGECGNDPVLLPFSSEWRVIFQAWSYSPFLICDKSFSVSTETRCAESTLFAIVFPATYELGAFLPENAFFKSLIFCCSSSTVLLLIEMKTFVGSVG